MKLTWLVVLLLVIVLSGNGGISNGGAGILSGTSASVPGNNVGAGACDTVSVTVTGVTAAMGLVVTPTVDTAAGNGSIHWYGVRTGANTVTVSICNADTLSPEPYSTTVFNVRAIP